ncbi:kinase-like domain-containing protein, partial [Cerioporus squamosus]
GRVYRARVMDDRDSQRLVAVKKCHVTDHVEHPQLQHEACALVLLHGEFGDDLDAGLKAIPHVYAWGKSQFYEYLPLELLDAFAKLTLRNLVAIAVQVLDGLEHIQSCGIVYCDVKPSNLTVGLEGDGRVRNIDFGICRPYRDPVTLQHLPDKGTPYSVGTSDYMSLNGHLHHSPSHRDDIESLSYTLLALMAGCLPWDLRDADADSRLSTQRERITVFFAPEAADFYRLQYARGLEYGEEPDYGGWSERFRRVPVVPSIPDDPLY